MVKSLQTCSKTARIGDSMFVWRQPTNMKIMGFGDGGWPQAGKDPIGISNVRTVTYVHVNKEIFENYSILGNTETWNDI